MPLRAVCLTAELDEPSAWCERARVRARPLTESTAVRLRLPNRLGWLASRTSFATAMSSDVPRAYPRDVLGVERRRRAADIELRDLDEQVALPLWEHRDDVVEPLVFDVVDEQSDELVVAILTTRVTDEEILHDSR